MAYVFFDIDGTLYDYNCPGCVPESAVEAIHMLKSRGHHPIICTGRTKIVIPDVVTDIGFDGIVAGGGSLVEWMGTEVKRDVMPSWVTNRLIRILRRNGFSSYPEGHDNMYYDTELGIDGLTALHNIFHVDNKVDYFKPIDLNTDMHVSKISALFTPESNRDGVIREMGEHFDWTDHSGILLETVPKHTSKEFGVRSLMEYLGEPLDDTYAFGDSFNDLGVLRTVQIGILMGSAKQSLLDMVPWHTDSMYDDGIYNGLKNFGLI